MLRFSFEEASYQSRRKKTRNRRFPEQMDGMLPWKAFLSELAPFYPRGCPPIGLEIMLRNSGLLPRCPIVHLACHIA